MKNSVIRKVKLTSSIFFFFIISVNFGFSQSISLNLEQYSSICAGAEIQVPVNLNGISNQSVLTAKFHSNYPDTTFYCNAQNLGSTLKVKIPVIYANASYNDYYYTMTIQSSAPAVESNEVSVHLYPIPVIELGNPLGNAPTSLGGEFGYPSFLVDPIDEYLNPGAFKRFKSRIYGVLNGFQLSDSTTFLSGNFYETILRPTKTTTYSIKKAWNQCGSAKIIPKTFTIKVNPFNTVIVNVNPTVLCNTKELSVSFDYTGSYNADNRFTIEIANIVGDTVRQLPTTTVNAKYLTTVLDNSFLPNYYYVRVKSSSPEGATPYVLIRILPKPVVTMNWYSINEATTVQYKQKVRVRFRFDNTTSLRGFRMSDGTVMNYRNSTAPELFTNSDWEFYPEKDYYYTVDSLIANCGVIKDFDVIGSRFIKVEKGFSILGVKKSYCIGETVKLKIDSPVSFGINNSFTAKMYQFGSLIGSFPASIKNDSLVFTISPDNGFNPALGTVQMRIESSNPFMLSSVSEGYFLIYNKPELGILNSSFNITMPGEVNIPVNVKSQNPLFVTINDGQRDSTFKFDAGLNEYMFTNSSFNLFVKKNTTYHIKSISNSCGVGKLTSANNFNVSVSNTDEKKIYLIGGALKAICLKKTVPIYFNAGGKFDANNEFVVYVNYYPTRLEVGRGKSSPIMVTLPEPENFIYSSRSGYYLSIESTSPYFRSDNNLYLYLQSSDDRVNFGISQINFNWSFSINDYLQKEKAIELIKGDLFNQGFTAPYEPYIDIPYRFKVNNQWIDQSVKFNIAKDTTLYLQGFQSSCGFIESRDSIPIKMKKYRIAYSFSGDGWRCMGDIADLNFTIEGEKFTQPYDFDVKFIPVENTTIKNSAEILQKKGNTYRIRIPDMPYEKEATIEVTPKVGKEDFAKLYVGNYLYLNKVLNIKLTAEDGSDTLWRSSYNYKVPKVKFETLNSFNPDWYGYLNSDDNYRIEQKIAVVRSYNDFYNSSKLIELTRVSPINSCGFPKFSGKVYVKICDKDVRLDTNYYQTNEIFSNTFISSGRSYSNYPYIFNIFSGKNVLFSAKQKIELMPGFSVSPGATFKAEIKGCNAY